MKKEYINLLKIAKEKYETSSYGKKNEEIKALDYFLNILEA